MVLESLIFFAIALVVVLVPVWLIAAAFDAENVAYVVGGLAFLVGGYAVFLSFRLPINSIERDFWQPVGFGLIAGSLLANTLVSRLNY